MNNFFGLDSKFYKYGSILADILIITLLWTITSLPIITVGASTTAMYYVITRQLSNREGYIRTDFFKSFKANFFQATGVTILFIVIFAVLFFNIYILPGDSVLFPIQFVLLAVAVAVLAFVFPVLSRFEFKFFELLRTSFFLAVRHFPTSFTCVVLLYAIYVLVLRWPFAFVVCAGVYGWLTSLMFMRVFKKYVPQMDTDEYDEFKRQELLAAEAEDEKNDTESPVSQ